MKSFLPLTLAVALTAPLAAQERPQKAAPKSTGNYTEDAAVVRESQEHALELAQALAEKAQDPKAQAAVAAAIQQMERALKLLEDAKASPQKLSEAVAAEQAAYAQLLRLAAREFNVSQQRNQSGKSGSQQQGRQRQLDQLDLKMSENRYEQQRQAQEQKQSPEQREQLQVLNRLQELARRQQDLNERLKELQTALQEAKSEPEKEDIRRRLKRLREEEQQMTADVDELKQRMEKPENQSRMAEERKQLDQTREQIQKAAEAMDKNAVQQALSSGTRAQRDLQQMRDELRKKSSNQFSEEMRQMRMEARELAQKEQEIGKQLDQLTDPKGRKTLADSGEKQELAQQLQQQRTRLTNLVEQAKELSERAETAEPLLHKQLYDTVRKNAQTDAANIRSMTEELLQRGRMVRPVYDVLEKNKNAEVGAALDVTSELLKNSFVPEAKNLEERARRSIEELTKGVERAADSVLGDEAESLRQARKELDAFAEAVARELQQADPSGERTNRTAQAGQAGGSEKSPAQSGQKQDGQPGEKSSDKSGQKSGEQSAQKGKGQPGQQQGEGGENGKQAGQSQQQAGKQGGGSQAGKSGSSQQAGSPQERDGQQPGSEQQGARSRAGANERAGGGQSGGEGGGGNFRRGVLNDFFNGGGRDGGYLGPIRGEDYAQWSDRLRDVEEMVEIPDLRLDVARIREAARDIRKNLRQQPDKPPWAEVRTKIVTPLAEVRQRLADELAKRESREALVPIDRDPVPGKFGELVRRYYQELGKSDR